MVNRSWLAVYGTIIMAFLANVDVNIVAAASELIQAAFSASIEEISSISSVYLIAEIIAVPTIALFIKRLSIKVVASVTALGFCISSVLCANAWSIESLIAFRAIQGVFGGMSIPLAYTMIKMALNDEEQAKAMGVFSITASLGPIIGPSFAGLLPQGSGYEPLFYVNVPICLIAIYLINSGLSQVNMLGREAGFKISFKHVAYSVLAGLSFGALIFSLEHGLEQQWFTSQQIRVCFFSGIFGLLFFSYSQWYSKNPVLNLKLLSDTKFTIVCLASMVSGAGVFGVIYLLPYYLIEIQGYSAFQISVVVIMAAVPQIILMPVMIRLTRILNEYLIVSMGAILFSITCFYNANLTIDFAGEQFHIPQIMRAIALPLVIMPLGLLVMKLSSKEESASASILYNISRTIGGTIGIAGLITIVSIKKSAFYQEMALHVGPRNLSEMANTEIFKPNIVSMIQTQSHIEGFNHAFSSLGLVFMLLSAVFFKLYLLNNKQ